MNYYRPDVDAHQASYHRAQRRRRLLSLAWRGGVVAALLGAVGLAVAGWVSLGPGWLRARLLTLRLCRIETLQVTGNQALSGAEVLEAAGLRAGESLLGLDLAAARARLVEHPRVREATLRRRLPGTVIVEIAERIPCVIVRADRDYLVDAEGVVVAAVAPGAGKDLPVLTGLAAADGALTESAAADLAVGIELVNAMREVGFPALTAVDHIDLGDPNDAVIVPVSGRPLVHAGRRDTAGRLRRWRLVAPYMAQRWPELEYVDLRADGQVVALPSGPAPEPAAAGKPGAGPQAAPSPRPSPGRPAAGGGHA